VSIVVFYNLARTSKLTLPVVSRSSNYRPPRAYSTPLLTRPSGGWVIDTRRPIMRPHVGGVQVMYGNANLGGDVCIDRSLVVSDV